jgi:DNA-binding transcriptional MerR regulator
MGADHSNSKRYTARDVKDVAGLTYRQLNDWESKGAVSGDEQRGEGWRKFSARDVFALMVCSELRKRFGIPLEKIKFVHEFMRKKGVDHLYAAAEMMNLGLSVYLLTDFKETFVMDSDLEFEIRMTYGHFREDHPQAYVFIRLNDIVNRLLGALREPLELKPSNALYRSVLKVRAKITACTPAEMKLLELVRQSKCDQVRIQLKDGKVIRFETEGDVAPEEITETNGMVGVAKESDFETVTLTRHAGTIRKVRKKTPIPLSDQENTRILFGGTWFTGNATDKNDE